MAEPQKWQYLVTPPSGGLEQLNALGDEGWELVAVDEYWCYLKQPKPAKTRVRPKKPGVKPGPRFEPPSQ